MAFVSVTRLKLRSLRFVLPFARRVWAIVSQARRSDGFLEGRPALAGEGGVLLRLLSGESPGFWTLTAWADEEAMRDFRNAGPHVRVMPKLSQWCSEASFVNREQEGRKLPSASEARERMRSDGELSRVHHPSEAHAEGRIPTGSTLAARMELHPT